MGRHPEDNTAALAALTGRIGGHAQLSQRGRPTHSAIPYLKQFGAVPNELAKVSSEVQWLLRQKKWFLMLYTSNFADHLK